MAWSIFNEPGGPGPSTVDAAYWAQQFLDQLSQDWGVNVDTPGNKQFIYDWEKSEGAGGQYNPLNQGPDPNNPALTSTGSQYGGGATDYVSWAAGLQGAADYLNMPSYAGIKAGLENNDPTAAKQALWASPWAASHYGYGANWANDPYPTPSTGGVSDFVGAVGSTIVPGVQAAGGAAANAVTGGVLGDIKKGGAYLVALGVGAALVVVGLIKVANPGSSLKETLTNKAQTGAQVAAMAA